jgi:hypothetical protein
MQELRRFLTDTVDLQTQFMVNRLETSLPKMLQETRPLNRAKVEQRFNRLGSSANGCYALVDYVNFKGEGVLPTERYHGQGWGLLQVLETMTDMEPDTTATFSRSAAEVLTRRVRNSPSERNEARWLPGWLHRVSGYNRS